MMSVPRSTSAMGSRSSRRITAPLGLHGKGSTSSLVFGVMAAFSCAAVSLKAFSAFSANGTGTPPVRVVMGS